MLLGQQNFLFYRRRKGSEIQPPPIKINAILLTDKTPLLLTDKTPLLLTNKVRSRNAKR